MRTIKFVGAILILAFLQAEASEQPIAIVVAENFYGEVAAAIGGDQVTIERPVGSSDANRTHSNPPRHSRVRLPTRKSSFSMVPDTITGWSAC